MTDALLCQRPGGTIRRLRPQEYLGRNGPFSYLLFNGIARSVETDDPDVPLKVFTYPPSRLVLPDGSAVIVYCEGGWRPSIEQIVDFIRSESESPAALPHTPSNTDRPQRRRGP